MTMFDTSANIVVITLDGIIGAGKSTLLKRLNLELTTRYGLSTVLVPEPSDEWERNGLLKEMYGSIGLIKQALAKGATKEEAMAAGGGWPALFQIHAFTSRIGAFTRGYREAELIIRKSNGKIKTVYILCERSIYTDKHVFAYLLYKAGFISDEQLKAYDECFSTWEYISDKCKPHLSIWLDTTVSNGIIRIKGRNREGEVVPEDYEEDLYNRHLELFGGGTFCGTPVIHINGNVDFHTCNDALASIAKTIMENLEF